MGGHKDMGMFFSRKTGDTDPCLVANLYEPGAVEDALTLETGYVLCFSSPEDSNRYMVIYMVSKRG